MNYQKAWLELKATLEQKIKTTSNPTSRIANNDILEEMERLENKMLAESGFASLVNKADAMADEGLYKAMRGE